MSISVSFSGDKTTQLTLYHVPSGKKGCVAIIQVLMQQLGNPSSLPVLLPLMPAVRAKGCGSLHVSPLLSPRH